MASGPQVEFLRKAGAPGGNVSPAAGGHLGARTAGWHRTAKSLDGRGLVTLRRNGAGCLWVAVLTPAGAAALAAAK